MEGEEKRGILASLQLLFPLRDRRRIAGRRVRRVYRRKVSLPLGLHSKQYSCPYYSRLRDAASILNLFPALSSRTRNTNNAELSETSSISTALLALRQRWTRMRIRAFPLSRRRGKICSSGNRRQQCSRSLTIPARIHQRTEQSHLLQDSQFPSAFLQNSLNAEQ